MPASLLRALQLRLPIVQGPMTGSDTPALTAAVVAQALEHLAPLYTELGLAGCYLASSPPFRAGRMSNFRTAGAAAPRATAAPRAAAGT